MSMKISTIKTLIQKEASTVIATARLGVEVEKF
jgi:hypothetical protein